MYSSLCWPTILLCWLHAGYIQLKKEERKRKLDNAREKGELNECGCCFDDELLLEDMLPCPEGHLFCVECIKRSSEELIGQAKVKFPCLEGQCTEEFTMVTLQKALRPKTFSLLLGKIQEEEIRQADIEDLVTCPFCSFATIMPNPHDKVLCCKNPECLKESCRWMQHIFKLNHRLRLTCVYLVGSCLGASAKMSQSQCVFWLYIHPKGCWNNIIRNYTFVCTKTAGMNNASTEMIWLDLRIKRSSVTVWAW